MPFLVEAGKYGMWGERELSYRKPIQYRSELLAGRYAIKAARRLRLEWWQLRAGIRRGPVVRKGSFSPELD